MAARHKKLWISLAVVAIVVVAAIVAVRLLLTRERLIAIVLPRVEKMVDAKVAIGDIRIKFPFGFGVDIDDLRFEKTLPDTTALAFSSETVTVRASLLSLIRRKPEITSAAVRGGTVALVDGEKRRETRLLGLESHFSMKPGVDIFVLGVKARIDSVLVARPGMPPAIVLEKIAFDGELETDRAFTRLAIKDGRAAWEDLVSVKITGEVTDIKTAPRLELAIDGDEMPIAPVLARVKAFKLDELQPAAKPVPRPQPPQPPLEFTGGTARFSARVEGLAREPLGMNLAFEADLRNAALAAGDLASIGKVNARIKGSGNAFAWQSLVPGGAKPPTLEQMTLSWQAIELEGTIEVADGEFVLENRAAPAVPGEARQAAETPPIRIAALRATAELAGTDVKRLSGSFRIGQSPYTFSGSLGNIMPAAAELALVVQKLLEEKDPKPVTDFGPFLEKMVNAPVVRFEVAGRSFDARPYQKPLVAAKKDETKPPAAAPAGAPGGPGAILFLKNTVFTAKLDSLVAREAVLTGIEAKGTIRDGRLLIEPLGFRYAGGTGAATVHTDLRKPARVESSMDVTLDGVEAGQALGRLISAGNLIQGRFGFSSKAKVVTGQGINPLMMLSASGSAISSRGSVNFEKFVAPLSTIQHFDVTPFKSFDFSEWSGSFLVKDGRFISEDWTIGSPVGAWAIRGSFGFDGTLDYAVHLVIPPTVQQRMRDIDKYRSALDLMRDASGNLLLDIRVSGTARHPSAMLDLTKAKSKAQDRILEGLKKKLLR